MPHSIPDQPERVESPQWGAVFALALCAGTLVASEFMPASLLTPMATALHLTDGETGRAITVSGLFAVLTSLSVTSLTRGVDRRRMLLFVVGLLILADALVGLAPNPLVLMLGRALLGVVIGTFWSMSAATVMRLVPVRDVPQALAVVNSGSALAGTLAVPLGIFLGQYTGWRGVFFLIPVPLAALALLLCLRLPSMPSHAASGGVVFRVLRFPPVALGMAAIMLFFVGQFALNTYLRPFMETVTQVGTSTYSLIQLIMGSMGLLGTVLAGMLLRTRLHSLLAIIPLVMAVLALTLTVLGRLPLATGLLLALWGMLGPAATTAWWTWLSKVLPHDAEAGGGVMVAVIQLAVTSGATLSGLLYDQSGYRSSFSLSALALCAATGLALLSWRAGRQAVTSAPA